ncbi:hypothetical protein H9N28_16425 [Rhodobacter capsulatus]|uniref:hypothetical protein n=1 Tax=Rhodobacter capsulatus TaxID=1061 RepID=UPI0011BCF9A5|nr:hypothetical protein [Rhodobacter capsulatus]QNR63103.1 hypothetical protein H9N28_16425 [Rhodobacter capsulatus]
MHYEQSDLFADIHCADRWGAVAGFDHQQPRSATDKTDGEVISARLFDDIHALANLCANAVIPESSSAPTALESVPDFVPPRDDARSFPLDGPIGTAPSFFVPVSVPLKRRWGAMRRAGSQKRLRIDCKFRGREGNWVRRQAPRERNQKRLPRRASANS